ncbi:Gfo/Idh/MocA family oxidoreductase [Flammeovirgaceae bacterium SG7u.111]|nr:Gfo/Idh/MocA family oxidoreductase [Flammeovirgaceae bacterium SG7u.132]WPO36022.1 Gfo/Idh/MocA family oxidoreductase [Flammeovirgaceae bacterium SG7u.111]
MSKVRWGILGPGIIAHDFAADCKFVGNAEVVAVASRNLERAQAFAKQYGIPQAMGSYEELYNSKDVDAIYVATPHTFHLEQSSRALESGKAVLCEKPITINPAELEQLISVANKTGNYLMEGMWTYFLPAIQKAQEWIDAGRIGEICHVKADFGYAKEYDAENRLFSPKLAGGSLLDMGVYTVAMSWIFMKQVPQNMSVISRNAPSGVDYDINIQFEYPNASASLLTSFRCKLPNWTYIIGEKGYIAIPEFWRAKECFYYEGEKMVEHYIDNRKGIGFECEIRAASQDILEGKTQSDIIPFECSRKLQEIMALVKENFTH